MCGRMVVSSEPAALAAAFNVKPAVQFAPRYNLAPQQNVLAIVLANGRRKFTAFQWGLVPAWSSDPAIGSKLINARAETAMEKPAFKEAFRYRRCLIVADGFYEWKAAGAEKQPYFIRLRSRAPMALAGLWDAWKAPDGKTLHTAAVVTVAASEGFAELHERMPAIVAEKHWDGWLDPATDITTVPAMLRGVAADQLVWWPVSKKVNDPALDSPELLAQAI